MDQDTLPTFRAQKTHVLDSAAGVLTAIGEQLGPFAERALRQRFQRACFFVGDINQELDPGLKNGKHTISQLSEMLAAIDSIVQKHKPVNSKPIYNKTTLVLGIAKAVENFHDSWSARLGRPTKSTVRKAHWKQVWALARRLAEGWDDHYLDLQPIADLHRELNDKVYLFIQGPANWTSGTPSDEEKQQIYDEFSNAVSSRVLKIVTHRIWPDRVPDWQKAFSQSGRGSSYARASIIENEIYEKAAPIPNVAPVPERDRNHFLQEVLHVVGDVATENKIVLQ
jgi:hypothetical protein